MRPTPYAPRRLRPLYAPSRSPRSTSRRFRASAPHGTPRPHTARPALRLTNPARALRRAPHSPTPQLAPLHAPPRRASPRAVPPRLSPTSPGPTPPGPTQKASYHELRRL